jgi:hypothetical protein
MLWIRVVELQLVGVDHHRLAGLLTAVERRVAVRAEVQGGWRGGIDLLERLLAVQDVGFALGSHLVHRDGSDPVAVGVDEAVVHEVGAWDVGLGDLPDADHHLGLLTCGVGIAVDGDVGVVGLVAAALVDLVEH